MKNVLFRKILNFLPLIIVLNLNAQIIEIPQTAVQSIDSADARLQLKFLASDALEGRGNGENGQRVAAEYIAGFFESLNLKPLIGKTYKQPFYYYESQLSGDQNLSFLIDEGEYSEKITGSLFNDYFIQYKQSSSRNITTALTFAGYGITAEEYGWNEYDGMNLKNRAAVVLYGVPEITDKNGEHIIKRRRGVYKNPLRKAEFAQAAGASMLIVVIEQGDFQELKKMYYGAVTKSSYHIAQQQTADIPIVFISQQLGKRLFNRTRYNVETAKAYIQAHKKSLHFDIPDIRVNADITFDVNNYENTNVLAVKEGTDPQLKNEYILISAHYDHVGVKDGEIYNGADDNASGTVGMLQIAEAYSRYVTDNKRSIIFAAFGGEELNLLGSRFLAANSPVPPENIVACLNLDMIGRGEPNDLSIIGIQYSTDLKELNEECNREIGFNLKYAGQMFVSKSDQWAFVKRHVPSIFYFAGMHEDYHAPGDDYDKINYRKLVNISRLTAIVSYHLSQSLNRPQWHPKKRGN